MKNCVTQKKNTLQIDIYRMFTAIPCTVMDMYSQKKERKRMASC